MTIVSLGCSSFFMSPILVMALGNLYEKNYIQETTGFIQL